MNRGSAAPAMTAESCAVCFNEAPIHESGKSRIVNPADSSVIASMRPRFMNRGSAPDPLQARSACGASMRPRFMNRGSAEGGIPR